MAMDDDENGITYVRSAHIYIYTHIEQPNRSLLFLSCGNVFFAVNVRAKQEIYGKLQINSNLCCFDMVV